MVVSEQPRREGMQSVVETFITNLLAALDWGRK